MMRGSATATINRRIVTIFVGLVAGYGAAAEADSPVYVDPGGTCNGLTPCHTTIQAGVNAASDPDAADGGAFAVVFVFPGTYDESVDISGINGGSNTGDLSVVTVDADGVSTPGTVTIQTAAGPAFRNSMAPYLGRFQIGGFNILVTGFDGLLVNVRDDVEIHNSTSNETTVGSGFDVSTTEGHLVVANSQAIDNAADGLNGSIAGSLTLTSSTFNLNGARGASVALLNPAQVSITGCTANQNTGAGFSFGTASDVDILMSHAGGNMAGGFSFSVNGPVLFSESTANGNGNDGVNFGTATDVDILMSHADGNKESGFSLSVNGPVLFSETSANGNGENGASFGTATDVDMISSHADSNGGNGFSFGVNGPVTVSDSTASDNAADGFNFGSATDVDIVMSHAGGNMEEGFSFGVNGPVLISESTAVGNGTDGFNFGTATDVDILATRADGNMDDGFSFGVSGPVLISESAANSNSTDGFNFGTATDVDILMSHASENADDGFSFGVTGPVLISESTTTQNTNTGFTFAPATDLEISNSQANENGNRGFSFAANGSVLISESTGNNNGNFGFTLDTMMDVTFIACHADGNVNNDGISFNLVEGPLSIVDTTANGNGLFGVFVEEFVSRADITGSQADGNGANGFYVLAAGPTFISQSTANGNASEGVFVEATGAVTIDQLIANGNAMDGILSKSDTDTLVTNSVANLNERFGFFVGNISGTANTVHLSDSTANENGRDGFLVVALQFEQALLERVTARMNGRLDPTGDGVRATAKGFLESFILRDSWIQSNADSGIEISQLDPKTMLSHEISGSIICDNGIAGVKIPDIEVVLRNITLEVTAFGNWWGDASGPTHPSNPGGTGNAILDGSNLGEGIIHFDPWIDTVSATATPAVVNVGDPVDVRFQFSDAAKSMFLGAGPGDPNGELPFELSTDNGDLTASSITAAVVKEKINEPNGLLSVIAKPAVAGPVTVKLIGPCGLEGEAAIEAIAADLSLTKTDDADPITAGDNIVYKLVVTNNGPDDATGVTVTDALPGGVSFVSATPTQGTCSEAAGVITCDLGTIVNGASASVAVLVQSTTAGTITNTADVAGAVADLNSSNDTASDSTTVIGKPGTQEPPASQPASQPSPMADCGAGVCGFGTFGVLPWMVVGLALTKRRRASRPCQN